LRAAHEAVGILIPSAPLAVVEALFCGARHVDRLLAAVADRQPAMGAAGGQRNHQCSNRQCLAHVSSLSKITTSVWKHGCAVVVPPATGLVAVARAVAAHVSAVHEVVLGALSPPVTMRMVASAA
jgi:hypothetical protein